MVESSLKPLQSELSQAKSAQAMQASRIGSLEGEKAMLERMVRDRDEELRGKRRMLESVQDEMVGLEMQLNMAEQRSARLGRENKELVDRWMEKVGRDAEALNLESKWE